jgi:AraC-like DNA-binding protein/ligand-binding sensor protein
LRCGAFGHRLASALVPDKAQKHLVEQLSRSQIYQDYERAFSLATGLPLSLRPAEVWTFAHHGKKNQNPFCALMSGQSRSCAACLEVQEQTSAAALNGSKTVMCFAGLCDTAVPVRLGDELVGFLQTGQTMMKRPSKEQFARVTKQLVAWGLKVDLKKLEEAYFQTRVLTTKQYEAMVRLLNIFAHHLALVSNQLLVQQAHAEPPIITQAKQYIQAHQGDELSLSAVAKAVNTSTFYFCKMFKKATGLHFTQYLSRVRIEKAKNLLLNPNLRVSEIAYEVGFQSLTHFNRVFKKVVGQSPTVYRKQLPKP